MTALRRLLLALLCCAARAKETLYIGYLPAASQLSFNLDNLDRYMGLDAHTTNEQFYCFNSDFIGQMISGAVRYAIEEVNADPTILADVHLDFFYNNTCGDWHSSVRAFMWQWQHGARAFIGPEVHCRTEAMMASAQNLPIISYKCTDREVSDKQLYPTFARTIPAATEITKAFVALLKYYDWRKFSIIYTVDSTETSEELLNSIKEEIRLQNELIKDGDAAASLFEIRNISRVTDFNELQEADIDDLKRLIDDMKDNTRIFLMFGDEKAFRYTVLGMGRLGLFEEGEYALVYMDPSYDWRDPYSAMNNYFFRSTRLTTEAFWQANNSETRIVEFSRNVLVIIPTPVDLRTDGYRRFWDKVITFNKQPPFKFLGSAYANLGSSVRFPSSAAAAAAATDGAAPTRTRPMSDYAVRSNRFACYLYDAVRLYAAALNELIPVWNASLSLAKSPLEDGEAIARHMFGRTYRSIQGFDMRIDARGDARGNFTLLTRQPVAPLLRVPSAPLDKSSYYPAEYALNVSAAFVIPPDAAEDSLPALRFKDGIAMDWVSGKAPLDEPRCGFSDEHCLKPKDFKFQIIGAVLIGLILCVGIVAGFLYRNRKYEKELAGLIWKIDAKEIQFSSFQCSNPSLLDGSRFAPGLGEPERLSESKASLLEPAVLANGGAAGGWPTGDLRGVALYRGSLVALKELRYAKKTRDVSRATRVEMKNMRGLHHDNVNAFMGVVVQPASVFVVREFCNKGSLLDVLRNDDIKLDQLFIASFVEDLLKGMIYIHESELRVHGNLKSTNCVISSRWTLQVADFGLHELRDGQLWCTEDAKYESLLWTAPEVLRGGGVDHPRRGTQRGDVYSFAIILHEVLVRTGPFGLFDADCSLSAKDVVRRHMLAMEVPPRRNSEPRHSFNYTENVVLGFVYKYEPFRPSLERVECQNYILEVLRSSWHEQPELRPDFRHARARLKPLFAGILKRNIMDHMMSMMEKYQNQLEDLVDERTEELREEQKRTEILLHRMLPKMIAVQLLEGKDVEPESYQSVTIYFSDIVGFTSLSAESSPLEVVNFLNTLYTLFDSIIRRYDVYKVETIGDAYMVVSGLPVRNGDRHAGEIATMALHLVEAVKSFQIPHRPDRQLQLRIGIHTGPCVTGVVGKTMPRYCLFGDTVNTASRMESNALRIHCSDSSYDALSKLGGYHLTERGLVPMKGKGHMLTYWLESRDSFHYPVVSEVDAAVDDRSPLLLGRPKFARPKSKVPERAPSRRESSTLSMTKDCSTGFLRRLDRRPPTVKALPEVPDPVTPGLDGPSASSPGSPPLHFIADPFSHGPSSRRSQPHRLSAVESFKLDEAPVRRALSRRRHQLLELQAAAGAPDSARDGFQRKRSMSLPDGQSVSLAILCAEAGIDADWSGRAFASAATAAALPPTVEEERDSPPLVDADTPSSDAARAPPPFDFDCCSSRSVPRLQMRTPPRALGGDVRLRVPDKAVIWEIESSLNSSTPDNSRQSSIDREVDALPVAVDHDEAPTPTCPSPPPPSSANGDVARKRSLSCGDSSKLVDGGLAIATGALGSPPPPSRVNGHSSNPGSPLLTPPQTLKRRSRLNQNRRGKSAVSLQGDASVATMAGGASPVPVRGSLNKLLRRFTHSIGDERAADDRRAFASSPDTYV